MIVTVLRDESVGPAWTWDPSVPETRWLRQNYIASNFVLKIPLVMVKKKTTPYQVLPAYLSKQGLSLKPTTGIYFGHHSQLIQGTVQRVLIFLEKYFFFFSLL